MSEADTRPLTPANQNPWYVLMTLYGEQEGEEVDWELHEKNRAAWNAWAGQGMSEEEREAAAKSSEVTVEELSAWADLGEEIASRHEKAWMARNLRGPEWPGMPAHADFVKCFHVFFERTFIASSMVFPSSAYFGNSVFNKETWFVTVTFKEFTSFEYTTFSGNVLFGSATFIGGAWFISTTFSGTVEFAFATLNNGAWFNATTFCEEANFINTTISGHASLLRATFKRETTFDAAVFGGTADFSFAEFSRAARFASSTFNGLTYFVNTDFGTAGGNQGIQFTDCHFAKPTNFRDARFNSTYPDFQGAVLHPETTFTAKAADDNGPFWPPSPADPIAAKESCAKIRNNLGKQGFPEDEHFFYRREMRFAGLAASNPVEKLAYALFGALSDYGYSFVRPVVALFWLWLLPTLIFAAFTITGLLWDDALHLLRAGGLSFANIFAPLGLHKLWFEESSLTDMPMYLKALGGFQTVSGAILLFLMALGLRTRFRMR